MAKIDEIDVNFKANVPDENGIVYYSCFDKPFSLHGFYKPYELGMLTRLPECFREEKGVNRGVRALMNDTTGGRVRFVTDSKTVAIRVKLRTPVSFMPHMADTGALGCDMYVAPIDKSAPPLYKKTFAPLNTSREDAEYSGSFEFDDNDLREITINFPLYNGVESLYIGVCDGCTLKEASSYSVEEPIVFYGSSITQGGCATRPGMNYPALLSRWLDADFMNLGFSGSDLGEAVLAEHIATLPMSVFVYAYGYNAPSKEHYESTYYPFYKIIREKNPDLPIIMMSSPFCPDVKINEAARKMLNKREIVIESYEKAVAEGDENLYFIDGLTILGDSEAAEATVDGTHPTDLGFYNMAKRIYPVLEEVLYE